MTSGGKGNAQALGASWWQYRFAVHRLPPKGIGVHPFGSLSGSGKTGKDRSSHH